MGEAPEAGTELAAVVREMIKHEDDLTNQRMSWFLTIEGLLFAALSFGWDKNRWLVSGVLAPAGFAVCLSCRFSLVLGPTTVGKLVSKWDTELMPRSYHGVDVVGMRVNVSRMRQFLWPWNSVPLALALAWVAAGVLRFVQ
jgi:hypothetical protein